MSGQTLDVVDSNRMSKDDEGEECMICSTCIELNVRLERTDQIFVMNLSFLFQSLLFVKIQIKKFRMIKILE